MPANYEDLLAATIRHLEVLKAHGDRHVNISPETLRTLSMAPPREVRPRTIELQLKKPSAPSSPPAARGPAEMLLTRAAKIQKLDEGPRSSIEKSSAFASLRERVLSCSKCAHLAASRKNVVFGVGNIDAQLMFVGEAPGADEDIQGEPFVGRAGELLTRIIQAMGLQRGDVYIANILKCRPDTPAQTTGNRKPTSDEMATCVPYLHEQIDLIRPRVIVGLGATAIEGLLGKTIGIMKLRGHWQVYRGTPLMPTFHPAYLLRNQAMIEKRKVWEDMLAVMEKLEMAISDKQRNYFTKATS
jgi:uracil-DNA glycosylase family 4